MPDSKTVKESLYDLEKALFARVWYDPQMKSRQVVQKSISFRTGSGDAAEAAEAAAEAAVDLVKKCLPSVADARRAPAASEQRLRRDDAARRAAAAARGRVGVRGGARPLSQPGRQPPR